MFLNFNWEGILRGALPTLLLSLGASTNMAIYKDYGSVPDPNSGSQPAGINAHSKYGAGEFIPDMVSGQEAFGRGNPLTPVSLRNTEAEVTYSLPAGATSFGNLSKALQNAQDRGDPALYFRVSAPSLGADGESLTITYDGTPLVAPSEGQFLRLTSSSGGPDNEVLVSVDANENLIITVGANIEVPLQVNIVTVDLGEALVALTEQTPAFFTRNLTFVQNSLLTKASFNPDDYADLLPSNQGSQWPGLPATGDTIGVNLLTWVLLNWNTTIPEQYVTFFFDVAGGGSFGTANCDEDDVYGSYTRSGTVEFLYPEFTITDNAGANALSFVLANWGGTWDADKRRAFQSRIRFHSDVIPGRTDVYTDGGTAGQVCPNSTWQNELPIYNHNSIRQTINLNTGGCRCNGFFGPIDFNEERYTLPHPCTVNEFGFERKWSVSQWDELRYIPPPEAGDESFVVRFYQPGDPPTGAGGWVYEGGCYGLFKSTDPPDSRRCQLIWLPDRRQWFSPTFFSPPCGSGNSENNDYPYVCTFGGGASYYEIYVPGVNGESDAPPP